MLTHPGNRRGTLLPRTPQQVVSPGASARSGEFRNFCKSTAACYPVKPSLKIGSGRGMRMVRSDKVPPSESTSGA